MNLVKYWYVDERKELTESAIGSVRASIQREEDDYVVVIERRCQVFMVRQWGDSDDYEVISEQVSGWEEDDRLSFYASPDLDAARQALPEELKAAAADHG